MADENNTDDGTAHNDASASTETPPEGAAPDKLEVAQPTGEPVDESAYTTDFKAAGVDDYDPLAERRKIRKERAMLLLRSPSFVIGLVIAVFWVLCALVPSLFTSVGPNDFTTDALPRSAPGGAAWFGTNDIGNDVFSRVIYGARPVLIVAPLAAILATIFGTAFGLMMGYLRGWVDEVFSRIIEAILSLPVILLALLIVTLFGGSRVVIIATIATLFTPVVTRTIRSAVMTEAQLDYVTSAKLRGEGSFFIMFREILPNVTTVAVVELTVRVGYAVFTVATLAFLGFGGQDATMADWGRDVSQQRQGIPQGIWWPSIFPALAIASLVIAVNLIADALDRVSKS